MERKRVQEFKVQGRVVARNDCTVRNDYNDAMLCKDSMAISFPVVSWLPRPYNVDNLESDMKKKSPPEWMATFRFIVL